MKPSQEYLNKARRLSPDAAAQILAQSQRRFSRRSEDKSLTTLELIALQLEIDDRNLLEWRIRWAEVQARDGAHAGSA